MWQAPEGKEGSLDNPFSEGVDPNAQLGRHEKQQEDAAAALKGGVEDDCLHDLPFPPTSNTAGTNHSIMIFQTI